MLARRVESAGSAFISPISAVRSCSSSHTATSRRATSTRCSTYCGSVPAVASSPYGVGTKPKPPAMFGLPAASTNTSTCRSPLHGTAWFIGETPLIVVPSGRQTSPSAWNPGFDRENPRSITSSTAVPSPDQPLGTSPVTWNQVVPQGAPHARPGATG